MSIKLKYYVIFCFVNLGLFIMGISGKGFSVHLLDQDNMEKLSQNPCNQFLDISKIQCTNGAIITERDIVEYNFSTHSMILTRDAWTRLMKVQSGKIFIVCVNREPIYWGVVWSSILSVSCGAITIVKPGELELLSDWEPEEYRIDIECGYPSKKYFNMQDRRDDPRIRRSLERIRKLNQTTY